MRYVWAVMLLLVATTAVEAQLLRLEVGRRDRDRPVFRARPRVVVRPVYTLPTYDDYDYPSFYRPRFAAPRSSFDLDFRLRSGRSTYCPWCR